MMRSPFFFQIRSIRTNTNPSIKLKYDDVKFGLMINISIYIYIYICVCVCVCVCVCACVCLCVCVYNKLVVKRSEKE